MSVSLLVSDLVTGRLPSARQSEIRTIRKTCPRHTGYGWERREGGWEARGDRHNATSDDDRVLYK